MRSKWISRDREKSEGGYESRHRAAGQRLQTLSRTSHATLTAHRTRLPILRGVAVQGPTMPGNPVKRHNPECSTSPLGDTTVFLPTTRKENMRGIDDVTTQPVVSCDSPSRRRTRRAGRLSTNGL